MTKDSRASDTRKHSSDVQGRILVFFMKLLGRLPHGLAGRLGWWAGWLVWWFAPRGRHTTIRNLELCFPDLDPEERKALAQDSLRETTQTAFELAVDWMQPADHLLKLITHTENEHLLQAALNEKKGVVMIAPHFGNWELANFYMAKRCDLLVMYKPAESPALDQHIHAARMKTTAMVAANKRGVLALYKGLAAGKVTGVLPDQEPTVKSGIWAPFFGITALTPRLVCKLVNDTGSVAIGYGCQRNPDGKTFHIFYEPVEDDFYTDSAEDSAAAMNRCVERIILRDPKQYQWEYKRFKRRPAGEANLYK